jgi:hypothetical protein
MKRLVMLAVVGTFVAMQASFAMAASTGTPDTGPGCGLGKVAWQNYPHAKTKGSQILMATTNGSFGTQTFGISTGTLGCTDDGRWWAEQKTTMFAELTYDSLSQEMAQGKGEHLTSLATLMGVPAEQHPVFFTMAQEKYESMVQAGEASPARLVRELSDGISAHPVLAKMVVNK